jgi:hypothetical protein
MSLVLGTESSSNFGRAKLLSCEEDFSSSAEQDPLVSLLATILKH